MEKGIDYIILSELPEEEIRPFMLWLIGQTLPYIEEEGDNAFNCAFKADYDRWKAGLNVID